MAELTDAQLGRRLSLGLGALLVAGTVGACNQAETPSLERSRVQPIAAKPEAPPHDRAESKELSPELEARFSRWKKEEVQQRDGIRKIRCTESEQDRWQASKLIRSQAQDQDEFAQPDDLVIVADHRGWGKLNLADRAHFAEWAAVCELDAGLLTIYVEKTIVATWEQKTGFTGATPADVVDPSVKAPAGL